HPYLTDPRTLDVDVIDHVAGASDLGEQRCSHPGTLRRRRTAGWPDEEPSGDQEDTAAGASSRGRRWRRKRSTSVARSARTSSGRVETTTTAHCSPVSEVVPKTFCRNGMTTISTWAATTPPTAYQNVRLVTLNRLNTERSPERTTRALTICRKTNDVNAI